MSNLGSGMTAGGPVIPYAGSYGGFMPYRMGGGGLTFQSRPGPAMGAGRAGIGPGLAPMGRSMPMSAGMGTITGASSRLTFPTVGGSKAPAAGMGSTRSMSVMPPNFGAPFRPPTSVLGTVGVSAGMSM